MTPSSDLEMVFTTSGRLFMICKRCNHWVGKLASLCECMCHLPSVKAEEDKFNE